MMFPNVCDGRRLRTDAWEKATKVNEPVYDIWEDTNLQTEVDTLTTQAAKLDQIFDDVDLELAEAIVAFPPMNSAHEGYAVIAEELDELWEHVRGKQGLRSLPEMRKEAVQVAAMAVRFILDVCDSGKGQV